MLSQPLQTTFPGKEANEFDAFEAKIKTYQDQANDEVSDSVKCSIVLNGLKHERLLEHLQLNARHFWEANSQQKAGHGKRPTVWLALNTICTKPSRFFIEEAVAALSTYVDVTEWGLPADTVIQGGEWWVRETLDNESIGFHCACRPRSRSHTPYL